MSLKKLKGYQIITNAKGQELYMPSQTYDVVNKLLDVGTPVFMYGAKGTSKTETAQALAIERGYAGSEFFQMETGAVTSGDQLDGYTSIDPSTRMLKMIPSELLSAVRLASSGTRTFLNADELNRVSVPSALNKLLRLLSQDSYATDLEGILELGGNLTFMATANVGYRGTTRLNEALMDRFDAIELKAIGGEALREVLSDRYGAVAASDVQKIQKFVDQNQKAAQRDDYEGTLVSTRDALRIARGLTIGMTGMEAVEILVGGQVAIAQGGREALNALIAEAKAQFAA